MNFVNFERLKNREDSSDFDDSWTKSIAPTRSKFSRRRANFRDDEKFWRRTNERTNEGTDERTNERADERTPLTLNLLRFEEASTLTVRDLFNLKMM